MSTHEAPLFKPLQLGSITLANRIGMSALTRSRAIVPNEVSAEYYGQRARGGAGLIVTEGIIISQQGTEWPNTPGIWSPEQVVGWKKVTDAVHAEGGHIFAQLWHVGRAAHADAPIQRASGEPVFAPSAVAARSGKFRFLPGGPGYSKPAEIQDPTPLIALFKQGAINAKDAGFDGVELHCASGYLIHQFLDSTSNFRTDAWGGSVEKRSRFGLEVLKAIISVFGKKRVAIKLSPAGGYNDVGMPLKETIETFSHFITEAEKLDLAYITLVRYVPALDITIDGQSRAIPHDVFATYRPFIKRTPLFLNGGLSPTEAASLVGSNQIDAAVFGFLWIGHPDLAKRIEKGKPLDAKVDPKTLYGPEVYMGIGEQRKGYTDYPEAEY